MKFYPSQLYPKRKFLPWNTFKLSKASEKYMCLNRMGTFPAHQMSSRSGSPVFRVTANDTQRKKSHLEFKWRSYDLLQKLKLRSCLCSCINCKVHKALQVRLRCVSSWNTVLISRDPSFLLLFWLPEEGQRKASPNTLLSLNVIFVPMAFFNRKIENKNAFRGNCALRFYHEYLSLKRFSKLGTNKQIKQFKKQEIALMWRRTWIALPQLWAEWASLLLQPLPAPSCAPRTRLQTWARKETANTTRCKGMVLNYSNGMISPPIFIYLISFLGHPVIREGSI